MHIHKVQTQRDPLCGVALLRKTPQQSTSFAPPFPRSRIYTRYVAIGDESTAAFWVSSGAYVGK